MDPLVLREPGYPRPGSKTRVRVWRFEKEGVWNRPDEVATEEPMEIRISAGQQTRTVAITMRTPGADFELAAGFLFGEGVVQRPEEIAEISYCVDPAIEGEQRYNVVSVFLNRDCLPSLKGLERHFYVSSACGLCGKTTLESLRIRGASGREKAPQLRVSPEVLLSLPRCLQEGQKIFQSTGGLHAAALFHIDGTLVAVREDVGRHNAMDKLVGWAFLSGRLPLGSHVVLVSGRASFELVQKSVFAGVPIFCAVSAPSSLAVAVAEEFGITLVGFLRGDRFNVYTWPERLLSQVKKEGP
ncbi:formate dehydrogenase accessory sulfurtransferase FdhD [Candidatus Methylacidithermus pantelleriae]|uniref:Sulfur carrier protein FdhD n=1 Tax=Candidatus Methylacidithermus pantelleriae TaxID=2744239 RepID=A0A8J2BRF1_9BACT|nr:formate dehydrogenase accessory sulfurtransferase FdhD [Candidatus Methylacidithermus pantelleriae]CAF0693609.1 Sulfur carrier protein FdhD [Candidatus Methylacidithermus pantelleriae]